MLYLTGTPIGNAKDISGRACEILKQVDVIACEDTRVTGILLKTLGIFDKKLISYHEHNKAKAGERIADFLKKGLDVALVTDAGMPAVSDPGEDLVKLCIAENLEFTVVPGPVAAVTALVMSGLSTRYYHFEGFLPSSGSDRAKRIQKLKLYDETIVIYEAPHRLKKLLGELDDEGFADCRICLCRELTKKYEEALRMTVGQAVSFYGENEPRGEYVICLSPIKKDEAVDEKTIRERITKLDNEGRSVRDIAGIIAEETGMSKKKIYDMTLNLLKS